MSYPFELKGLDYAYDALEPFIDAATMELHHSKHLNTYVTNVNTALENETEYHAWTIEQLAKEYAQLPANISTMIRNNAGGVYNHNLFFAHLAKDVPAPTAGPLFDAIVEAFGSVEEFKAAFKAAGLGVFGSGWAWLVADKAGKLSIEKTPNQDVPNLDEVTPILGLDVWEHAYYLKNQNRRPEYIDNFFNVIDWAKVEANYEGRLK